jgi:hypothetical protein
VANAEKEAEVKAAEILKKGREEAQACYEKKKGRCRRGGRLAGERGDDDLWLLLR